MYLESLWRGEIVTDADGVETLIGQMDAIRVLALSQAASLSMVRKALETMNALHLRTVTADHSMIATWAFA